MRDELMRDWQLFQLAVAIYVHNTAIKKYVPLADIERSVVAHFFFCHFISKGLFVIPR